MKAKSTFKFSHLLICGASVLALAACGGGDDKVKTVGESTNVAKTGKANKSFKSARELLLKVKEVEPETNCDDPELGGYPEQELIRCGGEDFDVFAMANKDRAKLYRFTFYEYRLTHNERTAELLKVFKLNEKAVIDLIESAWNSNEAVNADIGKYRLTASKPDYDMRIAIQLLSDVKAKEKAVTDSPYARRANELNTKPMGTRLIAIAYANIDLESLDPKHLVAFAKFNNAEKFKSVEGNEFKEPAYFETLNSAWAKEKGKINKNNVTQSYQVFLGNYDTSSKSFPVFQSQYSSFSGQGQGITIGNGTRVKVPVSINNLVDANGKNITIYKPQVYFDFSQNMSIESIAMPIDKAQELAASVKKVGDYRAVTLEVSGNVTDVKAEKDGFGLSFKVTMGYKPKSISIKNSQSDDTLFNYSIQ